MKWPRRLVMIRHGESVFNAAKHQKEKDLDYIHFRELYAQDIENCFQFKPETVLLAHVLQQRYEPAVSDPEGPLTDYGRAQARRTGINLSYEMTEVPNVIYVSPYRRAMETMKEIIGGWTDLMDAKIVEDERIGERDIGLQFMYSDWRIFNVFHPTQAKMDKMLGRFYAKPLNGESMREVRLRNRQILQRMVRKHAGEIVLFVAHGISILSIRSLLEDWSPEEFVRQETDNLPPNCGVTVFECDPKKNKLQLITCNKIYY